MPFPCGCEKLMQLRPSAHNEGAKGTTGRKTWYHCSRSKNCKPERTDDSYRPVTLTGNLCKLMERMLHNRLQSKVTSDHQACFQAGRSTTDTLMWLRSHAQSRSLVKNPRFPAVRVDFWRILGSVDHDLLLKALEKAGTDAHSLS